MRKATISDPSAIGGIPEPLDRQLIVDGRIMKDTKRQSRYAHSLRAMLRSRCTAKNGRWDRRGDEIIAGLGAAVCTFGSTFSATFWLTLGLT